MCDRRLSLPAIDGEDRARLLSAATELAAWHGDVDAAERFGAEAMTAWGAIGPDHAIEAALVLYDLGWGNLFSSEDELARHRLEESLATHRSWSTRF